MELLLPLADRRYRYLFAAQVIALFGTGLATVALSLLAFDLAGEEAGLVLGTAFTIKMVAYVGLAPLSAVFTERLPRRAVLVALGLVRASVALLLPFVTEIWQIYLLIFIMQAASAAFTPTFQATIPEVLPDEKTYTNALSLSRLAYDLENLLTPSVAAVILLVTSYQSLFWGTSIGFLASALLVLSVVLPSPKAKGAAPFSKRLTSGLNIYLRTPRLRGMLAIYLSVAAGGAMVIVNTVVLVQGTYGLQPGDVAIALACFGGGSMVAALVLPAVLEQVPDRVVMQAGAALMAVLMSVGTFSTGYETLLVLWALMGLGYGAAQTPSGRVLKRSSHSADRPALFAAQFALSHACWLLTYPLAGWLGAGMGLGPTFVVLAALCWLGLILSLWLWPASDREALVHSHPEMSRDDPHLSQGDRRFGRTHRHAYVIDDLHPHWPHRM
ncbi:MFS transporter [Pseudovibrio sp. SPO723]|uniref:MFS transporter n=1 Tax=Nesiotobacter zosterae TaxID=392721 RepID=UPI0029C5AD2A|nr:MFS transporter [Pseudovibrio sp. SPO723]MDX5593267.1 MFS transporter [Pseudovibrio sp. SPO723]